MSEREFANKFNQVLDGVKVSENPLRNNYGHIALLVDLYSIGNLKPSLKEVLLDTNLTDRLVDTLQMSVDYIDSYGKDAVYSQWKQAVKLRFGLNEPRGSILTLERVGQLMENPVSIERARQIIFRGEMRARQYIGRNRAIPEWLIR